MEPFLRLKKRTSYFRRRVPAGLRRAWGVSEISIRLGAVSRATALAIARRLAVKSDELFARDGVDVVLVREELRAVVGHTLGFLEDNDQNNRAIQASRAFASEIPIEEQIREDGDAAEMVLKSYDKGVYLYKEPFVRERLASCGLDPERDPVTYTRIGGALTLALALSLFRRVIAKAERHGLDDSDQLPLDRWRRQAAVLENQILPEPAVAQSVVMAPAPAATPEPTKAGDPAPATVPDAAETDMSAGPLFSVAFVASVKERISVGSLKPSAERDQLQVMKLWLEIIGNRPITAYGRDDINTFRDTLRRLPRIYRKSATEQAMSIPEIIAEREAKNPDYERIRDETVNKHLSGISAFFGHQKAVAGALPWDFAEFWTGASLKKRRSQNPRHTSKEARPAYSSDQIRQIFSAPLYLGRRSEHFYAQPGSVIVRDGLYWAPLIIALHGLRREEIAQVRVKHVKQVFAKTSESDPDETGTPVWCLELIDTELNMKTAQGFRIVPLHKWLLKTDFIDRWVLGRDPEAHLFPELNNDNAHGSYGVSLGKRFARVLDGLGIELTREDGSEASGAFHPLRHAVITNMNQRPGSIHVNSYIVGHLPENVSSEQIRYTKAVAAGIAKAVIDQIDLPVGIDNIIAAYEGARAAGNLIDVLA
ncbi:MAG: hypothetical protein K8H74_12755 [Notoacmeibacter sp.]|nr:hypothetical protein [Notoacmeibacter sp.]